MTTLHYTDIISSGAISGKRHRQTTRRSVPKKR